MLRNVGVDLRARDAEKGAHDARPRRKDIQPRRRRPTRQAEKQRFGKVVLMMRGCNGVCLPLRNNTREALVTPYTGSLLQSPLLRLCARGDIGAKDAQRHAQIAAKSFDEGDIPLRRGAHAVTAGECRNLDAPGFECMKKGDGVPPARERHAHPHARIGFAVDEFHCFIIAQNASVDKSCRSFAESCMRVFPQRTVFFIKRRTTALYASLRAVFCAAKKPALHAGFFQLLIYIL